MNATEISEDSKRILYDCLKAFDTDNNGYLTFDELPFALNFAGIYPTDAELEFIMKHFDNDGDGRLQISEMVQNWNELAQHSVNGEDMAKAFMCFDINKDGMVSFGEIKAVLRASGWTQREVNGLIEYLKPYDTDGDRKLDYREFIAMYSSTTFPLEKHPELEDPNFDVTEDYFLSRSNTRAETRAETRAGTRANSRLSTKTPAPGNRAKTPAKSAVRRKASDNTDPSRSSSDVKPKKAQDRKTPTPGKSSSKTPLP